MNLNEILKHLEEMPIHLGELFTFEGNVYIF